ncbi:MAG: UDP-N-acetylglucosamine diphosphorylase/glucosamine-1-phosphate N-acetyltransferase [Gammaproteobacteria bacterium]|nr:MAG: UDP-N-acetylglucosamine diphosphorylase/glucosamine-1-phosphate N-acetyltransferase [Gammaproteobacteria bacterium]
MGLSVVILAAGMGKRMKSKMPKVLHPIAGKPMVKHVIDSATKLNPGNIVMVYGHGGDQVKASLADIDLAWAEQTELLGTGDAVARAIPHLADDDVVLILYGDVPLITSETLTRLMLASEGGNVGLLTVILENPRGYGRIVRDGVDGPVTRIVEEKDASAAEKCITEVNTGLMSVGKLQLEKWLKNLNNDNAQGEYYLTDIIEMAVAEGLRVNAVNPESEAEVTGVNDRQQLAMLERVYQSERADELLKNGLYLLDPARFDIRGEIEFGFDCSIDINCVIEGKVKLGDGVSIGPNCVIKDSVIGDNTQINENSVLDNAEVGSGCKIGPFARLRPNAQLKDEVHVGNFVEVKKSVIGNGSKANHLAYIGDAEIGKNSNIGAGTITCNYDGVNKSKTIIGDEVFIGSDTQLVAPVTVEDGATVAAGTTVTKMVPAGALAITRVPQKTIQNWPKPKKK